MFPKPKTYRHSKYLEFVRSQPCCVCGNMHRSHPHHTEVSGTGIKGNDLSCIPLCGSHHTEIHHIGVKTFEDKYKVDIIMKNMETLKNYIKFLAGVG